MAMAVLTTPLQLLVLGALISPAYLQDSCEIIKNTTQVGSFTLSVNPALYTASTNYSVIISNAANSSSVILQALNSQNMSVGQWDVPAVNCTNETTVHQQNLTTNLTVTWTSPNSEKAPVEIRVFVILSDNSTQFQKATLNAGTTTTTTTTTTTAAATTSTTKNSSVSTAQASSFLMALIHLLSVFVTSKLFS
ncbi:placenta-expressed transcript 1 protein-like [Carettochelys insculpta]|uniref:placenta-expressed transcript 1 protein-like n=1 Tax=Carettochelys insculpta TaxID=44489 RepID=UPI003EC05B04